MSLSTKSLRPAAKAGSWYSKKGSKLSSEFDDWLSNSRKLINNKTIKALICPHAGYTYCGPTAAYAYHHICPSKIRRVFILGPDHRGAARNYDGNHPCLLSSAMQWETPFGNIPINVQIIDKLMDTGMFSKLSMKDDCNEHCIELIVPFLAYMFKRAQKKSNTNINNNTNVDDCGLNSFEIIPILVGHCNPTQHSKYAQILSEYFMDDTTLFIISSDFCHWGQNYDYTPFDNKKYAENEIYKYIKDLDSYGMKTICTLNCDLFWKYLNNTQNTICGRHSICILLKMVSIATEDNKDDSNNGKNKNIVGGKEMKKYCIQFVDYTQSSQVKNSNEYSVSYAAGVLYVE